jgi:hypothetical protein
MSNIDKQSSVDWFISQLEEKGDAWETPSIRNIQFNLDVSEYLAFKQQAKAMHKEEVKESYREGRTDQQSASDSFYNRNAESYYNETFGGDNEH